MQLISTTEAPNPAGHYSQAVAHAGVVFVAGQLPLRPGESPDPSRPVAEQVRIAVGNVEAILRAAGSSLDRLLSVTVYITDVADWPAVNAAYAEALGAHRPARTTVPVPGLHHGFKVEVQALAAIG